MRTLSRRGESDASSSLVAAQPALPSNLSSSCSSYPTQINLSCSSIGDVLHSRPSVGRAVVPRGPRLAKDSVFKPSHFRPSVSAQLRIAHWALPWSLRQLDKMKSTLPIEKIRSMNKVMVLSWAESTRKVQGAGLL